MTKTQKPGHAMVVQRPINEGLNVSPPAPTNVRPSAPPPAPQKLPIVKEYLVFTKIKVYPPNNLGKLPRQPRDNRPATLSKTPPAPPRQR